MLSSEDALPSRSALPSLQALRCFEAAGRTGSFKAAADYLHLTPSAISHRIADLEMTLGVPLFERGSRSIRLTEQGAMLYPKLRSILAQLTITLGDIERHERGRPVRLAVAPLFFSRILSSRMAEFHRHNPNIDIQILSAAEDASIGSFDCAIRFGSGRWDGCTSRKLFDVTLVAVGSPDMLARHEQANGVDISTLPLIDTKSSAGSWNLWCAISGLPKVADGATIVTSMTDAIAAAKQGMGVCLAVKELIDQELSSGELKTVWDDANPVRSAYWLIQGERRAESLASKVFAKWVLSQFANAVPAFQ